MALLISSGPQLGGTAGAPDAAGCKDSWTQNRACEVDFEGDTVDGDVPSVDSELILGELHPTFPSLIRYRTDFNERIVADADDV